MAVELKAITLWAKEIAAGANKIDAGPKEIDAELEEVPTALRVHRFDLTSLSPAASR